ncbi:MAG TPA: thiamine pyrophosphate-dependent enzyme [Candidatus Obscuribacter sp.]|nr:2-oxoacid ferredoxin oxidoreductase [Candidatus Melainabacteria bacterium]MBK8222797.1 2-oxoacid ferredoxin oxidoreductase [Candidatus Obscuribacter sp.]MBK9278593.1 2-oxoacid ferredoxin oxidoreductase [Candidatus Obscuribacter sp.]MBL8081338.1 2-oxoacid:ferredoxin oxidoreductase subunit beta [Candidatus Obscuribacter sp.]MDX1987129.1 thiamine pyrophosphate-dependent enzyme [Candidatus Obscuribacter sp.]
MATVIELPVEIFKGPVDPDWCPGCGDFGVLKGVQQAAAKCGIKPENLLVVSGIGCSSNLPGFIHAYGIHSLHGRAVPVATGAHLANTDLKVVITGGDGDGYGIGVGHLLHAMRRNLDVTYVVMDNQIYGLTTGQTSPTTTLGHKTKSTPQGNLESPLNPLALALTAGATYIARGFSGEQKHLADIIAGAIEHKGFSLVDVFSPCVTYNKINTYPFFKERVYKLEDEGWDPTDFHKSMEKAFEWGDKIPLGVIYKADMPTYEDGELAFKKGPLVKQSLKADKKMFDSFIEEMI